jgi:DNA-binding MurR/RpiR family transcriptional regulator
MDISCSFEDRLNTHLGQLTPAELRVARYFQDNREEVLIASASALAQQAGTSDATVVRTAKSLGFSGMDELRRTLAIELRESTSPAGRLARTLSEVSDDPVSALNLTLDIHQKSLDDLRRSITPDLFQSAVRFMLEARRVFIFGIGPSSAMAEYFSIQLGRFGIDTLSLTQTGLLLADGAQKFRKGDLLIIFAYGRVYRELTVLLDRAASCGMNRMLFSDTPGQKLRNRVDLVLPVARGRADMLSMHTATLALIEGLLVGLATERPQETIASLKSLNKLRTELAGKTMNLPAS